MVAPVTPRLRWDGFSWTGTIELPSWKGFQARTGAYGARSGRAGRAKLPLRVAATSATTRPGDEQLAAYAYLVEHDAAVQKAVLASILKQYPKLRAAYHEEMGVDPDQDLDDDDDDLIPEIRDVLRPLPEIRTASELRAVLGVTAIHILDVTKLGVAYVGFELGCAWDDEHGAGVMLHKRRVVEVGQADTSFLAWIAERDRSRNLNATKKRRRKPTSRRSV